MAERHYLEIKEVLTLEQALETLPCIVRIEVADEADARTKQASYLNLFEGKSIVRQHHVHNHEVTGNNKPCSVTDISIPAEEPK